MMPSSIPAFIFARGGSKRVPRKNIRPFCGKPMVAWVVELALKSDLFSQVIISTDDEEIAYAATSAGAVHYGMRPAELSNDLAGTEQALAYELEAYARRAGKLPEYSCSLYGTSCFATPAMLQAGKEKVKDTHVEMVMAVIPYSHPIERSLTFDDSGSLFYRSPEFIDARTQDLPSSYYDAGLFYWVKSCSFLGRAEKNFLPLKRAGVIVDSFSAIDIDTEKDWNRAERLAMLGDFFPKQIL